MRTVLIHDLTPILMPKFHGKKSVRTHRLLLPRILKKANLIITPSQTTKNDIKKHYATSALIEVIYPGIYHPEKDPTSQNTQKITAPIRTNASRQEISPPYILHLGTIEPRKNLPTLIDAFIEIKRKHNIPHCLVLAGGIGWKTEETLKKAKQHPDIILTGYISENQKTNLLKNAEIFVYPSFYEGFGIPPMEAMIHGIPTITSTGGSLKEIYENHALTHEPDDKKTLKKHLLRLIKDSSLRKKMSDKHKAYAKQFTWEATAEKTIKAFEKLMRR